MTNGLLHSAITTPAIGTSVNLRVKGSQPLVTGPLLIFRPAASGAANSSKSQVNNMHSLWADDIATQLDYRTQ
jgi:hypothetical protein